ncbi:MAG: TolB family protein, partial [Armatimonadota bacterium]
MRTASLAVALALHAAAPTFAQGDLVAFEIAFNHRALPPGQPCDGEVRLSPPGIIGVVGIGLDRDEYVERTRWRLAIQNTLEQPGDKTYIPWCDRAKGVVVQARVRGDATASVTTEVGDFEFRLSGLSPGRSKPFLDGAVTVRLLPGATQLTDARREDDYPAVAAVPGDGLWCVWQGYDDRADVVLARKFSDGRWNGAIAVSEAPGDVYRPRVVAEEGGAVQVLWAQRTDDGFDLFSRRLAGGRWLKTVRLTREPGTDFNHEVVRAPDGRVWMAWQAERGGQYDVYLARLTENGLRGVVRVTRHPANDWEPSVAADSSGNLWIAWDTYRNGSYDVYMRSFRRGRLGPVIPVAATRRYEAHASIACDALDRPWIAWDEANENWGLHNPGGKPRFVRLHNERRMGLACFARGGLLRPAADVYEAMPRSFEKFCELPKVTFDGDGRLWLLFRHLTPIKQIAPKNPRRRQQPRCIWNVYAIAYDGVEWTQPMLLVGSNGRNDQRVSTAVDASGAIWLAFGGDGRRRWRAEEPVNHNVFVAALPRGLGPVRDFYLEALPTPEVAKVAHPGRREPDTPLTWKVGGRVYRLIYGDTHRHTDMSRCGMNYDGSLLDTYRYAIDCARLDWIAISDHDQDILRHRYGRPQYRLMNYLWWRSQKLCDLFLMQPDFIAVYGYEHGGSFRVRGGHKNVLYSQRGMPCLEDDAPADLFKALDGKDALAIPHQLADGGSATNWDLWSAKYERVAEIYQARGSYEYLDTPRVARVKREG